jgi:hypothetical protein
MRIEIIIISEKIIVTLMMSLANEGNFFLRTKAFLSS